MNIGGLHITINHTNCPTYERVQAFCNVGIPFSFFDEDGLGPVFIPLTLTCIEGSDTLVHATKQQFSFSLSMQMGLWGDVRELSIWEKKELPIKYIEVISKDK